MSSVMMYKGYTGRVEIDLDAEILFGRVIDITDVITFQGKTVDEARQAFNDSVDDYLAFCDERGEEPERPFSGKILFRTSPERHRRIFIAANLQGKSVNAWLDEVLSEAAEHIIMEHNESTTSSKEATSQWRLAFGESSYRSEDIQQFLAATRGGRELLFNWNNMAEHLCQHYPHGVDARRDCEELNQHFGSTQYARTWKSLVEYLDAHSDELRALTQK